MNSMLETTPPNAAKNFGLLPAEFETLRQRLETGDEALVEVVFKKHFEVCRVFLVKNLGASPDTAYDIAKDTLLKFRRNLLLGKIQYGNMAALFTIDARNTFLRWQERQHKNPTLDLDERFHQIADEDDPEPYDADLLNGLKTALQQIGPDCSELLNWHYYLDLPLRTIAEKRVRRGDSKFINEDSVKTKIAECRKKLKKLIQRP
ncbi:MAG: RNA polymerase sigma factor [Saprospiraceae bacterium]